MDDDVRNEILNVLKSIDGRLRHIEETIDEDVFEKVVRKSNETITRSCPSPLSKSAKDTLMD